MRIPRTQRAVLGVTVLVAACAGCVHRGPPPSRPFVPPTSGAPAVQHLVSVTSGDDLRPPSRLATFVLGPRAHAAPLRKPYGVAVRGTELVVVDTRLPGFVTFDLEHGRTRVVKNGMRTPIAVAIGVDGRRYISDTGLGQILVFDRAGRRLAAFGAPGDLHPAGLAVGAGVLYVANPSANHVEVLDLESGQVVRTIGKPGSKEGELFQPTNVALTPSGNLLVADTGNFRVQEFTPEGVAVRSIGTVGTSLGQFARPKGIAVDRDARIYVVDAAFENVQVFDSSGRLLLFLGAEGPTTTPLGLPAGASIDPDGAAWQRFASDGFRVEWVLAVTSQFGPPKVDVFGFGRMEETAPPSAVEAP